MPNKREFKKYVDALGASVCNVMGETYYSVKDADKPAVEEAFSKVLGAIGAAKSNANRFFDRGRKGFASPKEYGKAKRAYFVSLFARIEKDFSDEINAALKEFNAALPESEKAANKEAAAK